MWSDLTAVFSSTGMFTNPNVIAPFQIAAIKSPSSNAVGVWGANQVPATRDNICDGKDKARSHWLRAWKLGSLFYVGGLRALLSLDHLELHLVSFGE